ncbi:hypothetical protein AMTRI_Chr10g230960 [Amborella trichopoda]
MLFFYMVLGVAAGYVAVKLWRTINSEDHKGWLSVSWRVACFFPSFAFLILTTLNFLLLGSHSTSAIPFSLFVVLILLWFCISAPLTFVGGDILEQELPQLSTQLGLIRSQERSNPKIPFLAIGFRGWDPSFWNPLH